MQRSLIWTNFYANGDRTYKGLPAILNGWPTRPVGSITQDADHTGDLPSLAKILKSNGYSTSFYYGGESEFANIKPYLAAVERADPNFEAGYFLQGARSAYDLIVGAFAKGDRDALRGLLTPRVYASYVAAIEAREAQGGVGPEIVRLKSAEIADAGMNGDTAQVVVKFEAELAEGATGVRDARERWTFERNVRSADPNWLLSRVQAA